jgi:integrase
MVEAGLCHTTRRNALLALRSVAKFAVEAKILPALPEFLPLPKRGRRVPSAPLPADVAAIIDAASCPEHRLVIVLAAHGGLRKGEIRALRCGDVELDRCRLVVRLSRYRGTTGPTKSGHDREVPLTSQLREALLAASVDKRPREECAALSPLGRPWGNGGPYKVLQTTLKRLNLARVRLHALRAFFVTTLLNGHVPPHVVRELAGHGDLATTQAYAAVVGGDRGAAVGVLDAVYEDARRAQTAPPAGESPARTARGGARRQSRRARGRIRELRRRLVRRRGAGVPQPTPENSGE